MSNKISSFIIGGSPSTGSSLLRQILNRHSNIVCAHETHIWAKKGIIKNWEASKSKLNAGKLLRSKDLGLFPFGGINKEEIPKFSDSKFNALIKNHSDIFSFFHAFMKEHYDALPGQIVGEKTPANAINFNEIFQNSNEILCIHTIRNPYDTIASLIARGKSIPEAVGFYLYNCSHALNIDKDAKLLTVRYENLVSNPQQEVEPILQFLRLTFEEAMIKASKAKEGEITKIDSWKYDEAGEIGKGSVGRFEELSSSEKEEVVSFVWNMKLKSFVTNTSIPEICKTLEYKLVEPNDEFGAERKAKLDSFNKNLVLKNMNFLLKSSPFTY